MTGRLVYRDQPTKQGPGERGWIRMTEPAKNVIEKNTHYRIFQLRILLERQLDTTIE